MMTISKIKLAAAAVFAAIVLVGGGVIVVAQVSGRRGAVAEVQPAGAAPAPDNGWRANFDRVYHLEPNEIVKRIAPPFIPEREQYLQNPNAQAGPARSGPGMTPDFIWFVWRNNQLQSMGVGQARGGLPLRSLLGGPGFGIASDRVDGPDFLLQHPMTGDWIVRDSATEAEKMHALAPILSKVAGGEVRIELATVEKDVIVLSGDLRPQARTSVIKLSEEDNAGNAGAGGGGGFGGGGGGGSPRGNFGYFLKQVGQRLGMPIVNESSVPATMRIQWQFEGGWGNAEPIPDGPDHDNRLATRLRTLAAETGLKFTKEKRKVDVWQVLPAQ